MMALYNTVLSPGERLRAARTGNGLTLQELADQVNEIGKGLRSCNRGVISDQERGRKQISPEYAQLYAQVLDVEPEFLMGVSDCSTAAERALYERQADAQVNTALQDIIRMAGYQLDEEPMSVIDGEPELIYYGLYKNGGKHPLVALTPKQWAALNQNVIDAVQTCIQGAIRMGSRLEDRIEAWDRLQRAGSGSDQ